MDRVMIGVDPHKLPVTIEARDSREILGHDRGRECRNQDGDGLREEVETQADEAAGDGRRQHGDDQDHEEAGQHQHALSHHVHATASRRANLDP